MDKLPEKLELKPERVQEMLARLPKWSLRPDGRGIERVREHASLKGAKSFASQVWRLASVQNQPVTIGLDGSKVVVTLTGHPVRGCTGGLTDPVFHLAELIG
ncbi:MAG: Pterin 4 alpha carbinolamine dehydratase [Acidobacteriota bacterium]|jgi:pterin-4a-carbinolamine dehydratase|nr:Pterin 4 alpha carbinolamine dehydratase [Acidobacteriota bacterium]